jgi:predicted membrane protein
MEAMFYIIGVLGTIVITIILWELLINWAADALENWWYKE